jgi:DNA-binding transcriptional LysR family regulator
MRSIWDAAPYLRSGRLQPVLQEWAFPKADIYLAFPNKGNRSAKTRVFVDFLLKRFEAHRSSSDEDWGW